MAGSFFTGTDKELYDGTKNFASMILTDFADYGLTSGQNTNYQTLSGNYVAAYDACTVPSTKTKGATAAKNTAKFALKLVASDLAKIIEGQSDVTDQQKVDLGLNVRATPSPVGELNKATDFVVRLEETGELIINFKATQPKSATGVTYAIWRKIDNTGPFQCLGGCGNEKKFYDATVPAGSRSVTYKIQAQRSTSKSLWAQFVVAFGVEQGETMIASVVETPAAKMAA
jgi:hypothetical protein